MKKQTALLLPVIFVTITVIVSCQKQAIHPVESKITPAIEILELKKKVYVTSLSELYAAVNDPNNAGTMVVIAPGLYQLNASYPNGGRLELQTDMGLQGQPGQVGAVLIDQSALPTASFVLPAPLGRTGGIRIGKGTNRLEWLSIKGGNVAANPFSVINTDFDANETTVKLDHLFIDCNGSNLGLNLRNRLPVHTARKLNAVLTNSELTGGVNFNGIALALQNANGASGSVISLDMSNNYIHGNKVGLLAFSSAQTISIQNCAININSHADRIEGNGVGIDFAGGINQNTATIASNNSINLEMHGSKIVNNNPQPLPLNLTPNGALPGGVYVAGGYNNVNNIGGFNRASDNEISMKFWGVVFAGNNGADIYAYGAWSVPAAILAGTNNLVEVYLYGVSANAIVEEFGSEPTEPGGSNVVHVYRN